MSQASVPHEGTANPAIRGNLRATIRYRCAPATLGKVFLNEDQEYQRACVINLSLHGIGLQLTRRIEPGQFIHLSVRSTDRAKTYELVAQVVHCSIMPQGEWFIGCELTTPLSAEDLDQLL